MLNPLTKLLKIPKMVLKLTYSNLFLSYIAFLKKVSQVAPLLVLISFYRILTVKPS